MSTNDNGGAAFPQHGWTKDPDVLVRMQENGGMSLRDYFAAKAFHAGLMTYRGSDSVEQVIEEAARLAYVAADAMLRARGAA